MKRDVSVSKIENKTTDYLSLAVGVVCLSLAGPLVKMTEEAGSFAMGFIRLTLGTIFVLPLGKPWEIRKSGKSVLWAMLSGLFMFIHFTSWFFALKLVSVAVAVTLLATLPVFVIFFEYLFYRKIPYPLQLVGIVIAIAGTVLISFPSFGNSSQVTGILYMFAAASAGSLYLICSVQAQKQLSIWQTVSVMYPTTAFCFLIAVLLTGQTLTGYSSNTYLWILAVAVVPQFVGHTALNLGCKSLSPVIATTATLVEPAIASVIAWFAFGQNITWFVAVGGIIVLFGVFITIIAKSTKLFGVNYQAD